MMRQVFALLALALPAAALDAQAGSQDARHATALPGNWSYMPAADGSAAVFRDTSGRAQMTIYCTRSTRRVALAKPADAAAASMSVWTSSEARNLQGAFDPATGRIISALSAFDKLFDAMAFSRGRISASVAGAPALVMPAWPEVARVVEDCRS